MTDAVKMAIERIKARFHPHYGIDGASDSKQLASDCQTLISALEQAGEPVAYRQVREIMTPQSGSAVQNGPHAQSYGMTEIQRLGQEFDAGEGVLVDGDAAKHMRALGHIKDTIPSYMGDAPKAQHYQALHAALDAGMDAIQNVARHAHKPVAYYYSDGQQEWLSMRDDDGPKADCDFKVIPLYAHPPQSRGQAFDGELPLKFDPRDAKRWWEDNMRESKFVSARLAGDGYVKFQWRDADESGDYSVPWTRIALWLAALSSAKRGEGK
jgi:hypothetical protein